jgi:hypothetical protein
LSPIEHPIDTAWVRCRCSVVCFYSAVLALIRKKFSYLASEPSSKSFVDRLPPRVSQLRTEPPRLTSCLYSSHFPSSTYQWPPVPVWCAVPLAYSSATPDRQLLRQWLAPSLPLQQSDTHTDPGYSRSSFGFSPKSLFAGMLPKKLRMPKRISTVARLPEHAT